MIHFVYLTIFAFVVSVAFAVFSEGTEKQKFIIGLKYFGQFIGISLLMAWIFYFLPW